MIIDNIAELLTMARRAGDRDGLGLVRDAAVLVEGGRIAWAGPRADLPEGLVGQERVNARGAVVMPGWIDCHTHLVYAGDRAADFERRSRGLTYEDIARRGGGIVTTVEHTRRASQEELVEAALPRLERLAAGGVTCVEIKSGYGLDTVTELKLLGAIRDLRRRTPVELVPTFLGAHVVPREFGDRRGAYLDLLVHELLPEVARQGLAEACDVFCDQGAFTLDEARRVLEAALALGLKPKVHAEQLSNTGAVQLACELGALSADHLEQASAEDVARLARSNTVPVLLPGSSVFLGRQRHAPGRALCDAGARPAVSTDCNPGSANTTNLALVATLAVTLCGLTVAEALAGVTREAARALGRGDRLGTVEVGKQADLALFDVPSYPWILYEFGQLRVARVMRGGEWV